MSSLTMHDTAGKDIGQVVFEDSWFARDRGEQAVYETIVAYQAAQRSGAASTKIRSEVRGGGAKPWRQKGLGRARAGSNRSPIWVGGGTTFGPRPRKYHKKVNKRVKHLALRRVLTDLIDEERLILVQTFAGSSEATVKTKAILDVLANLSAGNDVLLLTGGEEEKSLERAVRNLPKVSLTSGAAANVYELMLHEIVVVTAKAYDELAARLGKYNPSRADLGAELDAAAAAIDTPAAEPVEDEIQPDPVAEVAEEAAAEPVAGIAEEPTAETDAESNPEDTDERV